MTPELFFLLGVMHAAIAILTTAANLQIGRRRVIVDRNKEAAALRAALAAELSGIASLFKENIEAVYSGREVLVSSRMVGAIYRGNLGRIHTLDPAEIPALVNAYAMSERAEAYAAAHCKPHGANAFSMGKERPFAESLVAVYEKAAAAADRALRALAPLESGAAAEAESSAEAPARAAQLAAA